MRLKLICCDTFAQEVEAAAARSSNRVEVVVLPKAPHQLTHLERVLSLQVLVDSACRSRYQAVLMMAGNCRDGLTGLQAGPIPLVLPKVRDCLSLLLPRSTPRSASESQRRFAPKLGSSWAWTVSAPRFEQSTIQGLRVGPSSELAMDSLTAAWKWREHLGGKGRAKLRKPGLSHQQDSILELLLEGYWNYNDFLVVPPRWRVTVHPEDGTLNTQESDP
jgi:hypothetical protein